MSSWLEWDGNTRFPEGVGASVEVDVTLRDGTVYANEIADRYAWTHSPARDDPGDILYWRLAAPKPGASNVEAVLKKRMPNPLDVQVAGSHYKDLKIQPVEYNHANNLPFIEGSVVKYVTRWRAKGGIKDLEKARHFIDLLIELESRATPPCPNP